MRHFWRRSWSSPGADRPAVVDVREGRSDTLDLRDLDPGDQFTKLPDFVRDLTGLRRLVLGTRPVTTLPTWLADLPHLAEIEAVGAELRSVPSLPNVDWYVDADVLWRCATTLDLRRVRSVVIDDRTRAGAVHGLAELIADGRIELRELILNGDAGAAIDRYPGLAAAAKYLDDLVGAQRLEIFRSHGLDLQHVPEVLRAASTLTTLEITQARLTSLPHWLFGLPALQELDVSRNFLRDLPRSISGARRLRHLNLAVNSLSRVPDGVWDLGELRSLDLSSNQLSELPSDVLRLKALTRLDVDWDSLVTPPPEVAEHGFGAIKNYWVQQQYAGVDFLTEAKLLIVGEPGAGKTSLARKIIDRDYALRVAEPSTEGIDVLRWQFPATVRVPRDGVEQSLSRDLRVNVWDFGGQEIYHATHQFFLTKRSAYVLVVDERKEDADLEYWLEIVELLSGGSPLIIVQNCKQGRRRVLDLGALRKRYPNLRASLSLDLADNTGLDDALRTIRHEMGGLRHIGTELPKTWRDVRVALEGDRRDHITAEEFFRICGENGFASRGDMCQLGDFLHDLGICLFFQEDAVLRNRVILKPEWGTKPVYRVLDDEEIKQRLGVFTKTDLIRMWPEPTYADMRDELLQLMIKFKLCYPIPDSTYVAPQLLSPTQPAYHWDDADDLALRYQYDVMPKGIVRRVIVELHDLIEDEHVWRTGVVFAVQQSRVEVVEEYHRRRLLIRLAGADPRILLDRVDRALDVIHRSYPDIKLTKYRPCICEPCGTSPEPEMFAVEHLRRFVEARKQIQCRKSMLLVDPVDLLADLVPGERLPRRPAPSPREVFVSYKWGGAADALVDEIVEELAERGVTVVRDRNELRYRDSIQDFMRRLGSGKAVVVVLDRGYLESKNCMFELTEIASRPDFAARVLPVVLPDAEIFDAEQLVGYVEYWEDKREKLNAKMLKVGQQNLQGIRDDLDLYERIRNTIARLTSVIADMNTLTPDTHRDTRFTELYTQLDKMLDGA